MSYVTHQYLPLAVALYSCTVWECFSEILSNIFRKSTTDRPSNADYDFCNCLEIVARRVFSIYKKMLRRWSSRGNVYMTDGGGSYNEKVQRQYDPFKFHFNSEQWSITKSMWKSSHIRFTTRHNLLHLGHHLAWHLFTVIYLYNYPVGAQLGHIHISYCVSSDGFLEERAHQMIRAYRQLVIKTCECEIHHKTMFQFRPPHLLLLSRKIFSWLSFQFTGDGCGSVTIWWCDTDPSFRASSFAVAAAVHLSWERWWRPPPPLIEMILIWSHSPSLLLCLPLNFCARSYS